MAGNNKAEIIIPPNTLRAKVGASGIGPVVDPEAVRRAERTMAGLQQQKFAMWLSNDIEALAEANIQFSSKQSPENASTLFRTAHDLKGQAATFEFPLIARAAASLAKLMDGLSTRETAPLPLVKAHVDAIQAIHRDKIKDVSNLMALMLVEELEARVLKTLERAAA